MGSPSSLLCASPAEGKGTAFDLQRDSVIIMRLSRILRDPLERERQSLTEEKHSDYQKGLGLARQRSDRRFEQIRIEEMEEKTRVGREYEEGISLLEQEYEKKLKELEESFYKELEEQKKSLDNEINALDIAQPPLGNSKEPLVSCVNHQHHQGGHGHQHPNAANALHPPPAPIGGKKFLRSRLNEALPSSSSADSVTNLGAVGSVGLVDGGAGGVVKRRTQTKKGGFPFGFLGMGGSGGAFAGSVGSASGGMSNSSLTIPYLLSGSAISEDVQLLGIDSTHHNHLKERSSLGSGLGQDGGASGEGMTLSGNPWHSAGGEMADEEGGERAIGPSGRHHRRVLLEQNKLILDGKTFHRFQNVYIELISSGRMPATIRSISEGRYAEFRSVITGDIRVITATKDDLESGRVRAEFEAICRQQGICLVPKFSSDGSHVQLLEFPNGEADVQRLLERAMLVKWAFELVAEGDGHEEVMAKLGSDAGSSLASFDLPEQSWCLLVRPQRRKRSGDYIRSVVQRYTSMPLLRRAPVELMNPQNVFTVIEMYGEEGVGRRDMPNKVFFARLALFSLSSRRYIGNSTMDPELAFIQTNLANVRPGAVVMDPFCGTGGLLLSAAHFGSYVFGVEIKWDVARAKGKSSRAGEHWLNAEQSIRANFDQYDLCDGRFLGVVLADSSRPELWHHSAADGTIDAIITDPPYGIRERGQRLGVHNRSAKGDNRSKVGRMEHKMAENGPSAESELTQQGAVIGNEEQILHFDVGYPEKQKYAMSNVFLDLMDLAARLLRPGGRLAFWFPVYSSRRLLVYEKFRQPLVEGTDQQRERAHFELDCYAEKTFRQKVFNNNSSEGVKGEKESA
uniref:tRNA (guanine(10)-N(2))-methyltransferase TRMT11 n=1 Tax=Globodera pallida TaxID=36090 RepID=A0A183CBX3_GLOPA